MKTVNKVSPIKRTRVRLGRIRDEAALPDKVLECFRLNVDPQTHIATPKQMSYSELWQIARAKGFTSKGTFQKYLDQLVTAGLVIHDIKHLYALSLIALGWEFTRRHPPSWRNVADEEGLVGEVQVALVWILSYYNDILRSLTKIQDRNEARKALSVLIRTSGIQVTLSSLAELI